MPLKSMLLLPFLTFIASAQAGEMGMVKELGSDLRECYNMEAFGEGLVNCLPPSEIIPAIRSLCRPQANAMHFHIQSLENKKIADSVMSKFLIELEEDSFATILKFQSANKTCRNS